MGYIPPVPFLSHYPFKCSASTEVRALFFRWGSRHKVCLEEGGGGGIFSPHLWTRHQARKCSLQCTVLRLLIIQLQLATIMAKFIPTTCVTLILIAMFSTAHWRSSSGDSVALLSRTICTTVVVSDWCITNLAHGWWVSIQSIVGTVTGRNWSLRGPLRWKSVVMLGADFKHPRFRNLNSTVPADVGRHLTKNPQPKWNLQRYYHTSKVYLNHFVFVYNSMAYDLFSNPIQH